MDYPVSSPLANRITGIAVPPAAWNRWVDANGQAPAPSQLTLTPDIWQTLQNVQSQSRLSPYSNDPAAEWRADINGNCIDKSLAMRALLTKAGIPAGATRLALVKDEAGEDHALLTVDTDHGSYALDERATGVVPWSGLPYTWIAREHPGAHMWEALNKY